MKKEIDLYAIAEMGSCINGVDGSGSVVLSKDMIKELRVNRSKIMGKITQLDECHPTFVFVFWNKGKKCFAFTKVKLSFTEKASCELISYNKITDEYGFTATCPTVQYMFYHLKIEDSEMVKFKIERQKVKGTIIYNMTSYEPIER